MSCASESGADACATYTVTAEAWEAYSGALTTKGVCAETCHRCLQGVVCDQCKLLVTSVVTILAGWLLLAGTGQKTVKLTGPAQPQQQVAGEAQLSRGTIWWKEKAPTLWKTGMGAEVPSRARLLITAAEAQQQNLSWLRNTGAAPHNRRVGHAVLWPATTGRVVKLLT